MAASRIIRFERLLLLALITFGSAITAVDAVVLFKRQGSKAIGGGHGSSDSSGVDYGCEAVGALVQTIDCADLTNTFSFAWSASRILEWPQSYSGTNTASDAEAKWRQFVLSRPSWTGAAAVGGPTVVCPPPTYSPPPPWDAAYGDSSVPSWFGTLTWNSGTSKWDAEYNIYRYAPELDLSSLGYTSSTHRAHLKVSWVPAKYTTAAGFEEQPYPYNVVAEWCYDVSVALDGPVDFSDQFHLPQVPISYQPVLAEPPIWVPQVIDYWEPDEAGADLWLDAIDTDSLPAYTDGADVTSWTNLIDNQAWVPFSATQRPIYDEDGWTNGVPTVSYDGVDDTLVQSLGWGGEEAIVIVGLWHVAAANNLDMMYEWQLRSTVGKHARQRLLTGAVQRDAFEGQQLYSGIPSAPTRELNAMTQDASGGALYIDGVAQTVAANWTGFLTASTPLANFYVGSSSSGNYGAELDVVSILAFGCTSATRTSVLQKAEGYLAHRYDYEASLPVGHPYLAAPPMDGSFGGYYGGGWLLESMTVEVFQLP